MTETRKTHRSLAFASNKQTKAVQLKLPQESAEFNTALQPVQQGIRFRMKMFCAGTLLQEENKLLELNIVIGL